MKIKVIYDCDENNAEIMTLETFVNRFNCVEINSATDTIALVKDESNKGVTNIMTKTKVKEELIEEIVFKGSQSVSYREIYKIGDYKIKLEIKSDAYDVQSYARAYVLKELEWSLIYSIPYSKMSTPVNLECRRMTEGEYKQSFKQDRDKLKKEIETILL